MSIGSVQVPLWVLVAWIVLLGAAVPFWLSISAVAPRASHGRAGLVATIELVFASIVARCGSSRCSPAGR